MSMRTGWETVSLVVNSYLSFPLTFGTSVEDAPISAFAWNTSFTSLHQLALPTLILRGPQENLVENSCSPLVHAWPSLLFQHLKLLFCLPNCYLDTPPQLFPYSYTNLWSSSYTLLPSQLLPRVFI